MPIIAILTIGVQVLCIIHAVRSGRTTPWMYIIMLLPGIGSAAYVLTEILPELLHSRTGRQVRGDITRLLDPDAEYRRLVEQADVTHSADAFRALAAELTRRGEYDKATLLFDRALAGPMATDPMLLMGLAELQFARGAPERAVATLDRLRDANPDFQSQSGHLLYARSLEAAGRGPEAVEEYRALCGYYSGEEPRARLADLLDRSGDMPAARQVWAELVQRVEKASTHYYRGNRPWYDEAKKRLKA